MKNAIATITNYRTFKNPETTAKVAKIDELIANFAVKGEELKLNLAKFAAEVETAELYKAEEFTSATDFLDSAFGLSYSTARAYIQVGKAINAGNLPETDSNGKKFNFSQLRSLVAVKDEKKRLEEVATGSINADMGENAISDRAKEINPQRKAPKEKLFDFTETETDESSTMTEKTFIAWLTEKAVAYSKVKVGETAYYIAMDAGEKAIAFRMVEHKETVESK